MELDILANLERRKAQLAERSGEVHGTTRSEARETPPPTRGITDRSSVSVPRGSRDGTLAAWWNRTRYRLYAPVYRWVAKPLEPGRKRAIERLNLGPDDRILVLGSGPGVDLAYLPAEASITAIDITPAMVRRTEAWADELGLDVDARVGDAQSLPADLGAFDAVLLHLVLSVVPDPSAVVAEAARVLAPDGRLSIYDKFVPRGRPPSRTRRLLNPVARFLFSDITRRLDPIIGETGLVVGRRESFLRGLYTVTVASPSTGSDDD